MVHVLEATARVAGKAVLEVGCGSGVDAVELARRGRLVVVTGHVIDNVLGRRSFREFAGRHLRWARLRRRVNLPGYLGEALLNPVFVALALFTHASAVQAAATLAAS